MEARPTALSQVDRTQVDPAQVDPSSTVWVKYYSEASRRFRRARHRRRREQAQARRKRRLAGTLLMIGSMMLVGLLTAVFYSVLTR